MTLADKRILAKASQILERELQIEEQKLGGLYYQLGREVVARRGNQQTGPTKQEG